MRSKDPKDFRETGTLKHIWSLFRQDRIALFSFYALLLLISTALLSPFIAPYSAETQFIGQELMPPSWAANGEIA